MRVKVGSRIGRWTVLSDAGGKGQQHYFACVCACGTERNVVNASLRMGRSLSCGCWNREKLAAANITHDLTDHPLYQIWLGMRTRCNNPRAANYPAYGGRGIKVCDRWNDISIFIKDMGNRPEGTTLDRIDNDGDYKPGNVRWASPSQQSLNRRSRRPFSRTISLTAFGETLPVREWSQRTGITRIAIYKRLERGWSPEQAVSKPMTASAPIG